MRALTHGRPGDRTEKDEAKYSGIISTVNKEEVGKWFNKPKSLHFKIKLMKPSHKNEHA